MMLSTATAEDMELSPPPFAEGLDDWSRGDGTPESPTYEDVPGVRLARCDPDFGTCLELRKAVPLQRLRYMGEVPIRRGACVEVTARLKALRGPLVRAQIAAWPGALHGRGIPDLPTTGPLGEIAELDEVLTLTAVIGPEVMPGIDLVWDARAVYAHVGLDLLGPTGGVVRIADLRLRDVTRRILGRDRRLPGF